MDERKGRVSEERGEQTRCRVNRASQEFGWCCVCGVVLFRAEAGRAAAAFSLLRAILAFSSLMVYTICARLFWTSLSVRLDSRCRLMAASPYRSLLASHQGLSGEKATRTNSGSGHAHCTAKGIR